MKVRTTEEVMVRGGSEGELLQHSLLLDLLDFLCPERGQFWFLASQARGGGVLASEKSMRWARWMRAHARKDVELAALPLWKLQEEALQVGEYLDSSMLAVRSLLANRQSELSLRWILCHSEPLLSGAFREHMDAWLARSDLGKDWEDASHRMYQVLGLGQDVLQEFVYFGNARAPGLALIEISDFSEELSEWMFLLETLLMRRFWVMLVLPKRLGGKARKEEEFHYDSLMRGLRALGGSCVKWSMDWHEQQSKREVRSEVCVLSPGGPLEEWSELAQESASLLWRSLREVIPSLPARGIELEWVQSERNLSKLERFERSLPEEIFSGLKVCRVEEEDLEEVIRLWERLMDEHAKIDDHFQRRSMARLYLRRSFRSHLTQPDHLLLMVRWHHRVVGFLSAQVLRAPLFRGARIGQIVDVYILPEWRGQKIGNTLVQKAFDWFRALNLPQVDLNVAVGNEHAESFWESQGFSPYLRVVSKVLKEESEEK